MRLESDCAVQEGERGVAGFILLPIYLQFITFSGCCQIFFAFFYKKHDSHKESVGRNGYACCCSLSFKKGLIIIPTIPRKENIPKATTIIKKGSFMLILLVCSR